MNKPPVFSVGEALTAEKMNALSAAIRSHVKSVRLSPAPPHVVPTPRLADATLAPFLVTGADLPDVDHELGVYTYPGAVTTDAGAHLITVGRMDDSTYGERADLPECVCTHGTIYAHVETDSAGNPVSSTLEYWDCLPCHRLPDLAADSPGSYHIPLADVNKNPLFSEESELARHVTLRHLGDVRLPTVLSNAPAHSSGFVPESCKQQVVPSATSDPSSPAHSAPLLIGKEGQAWAVRQLTEAGGVSLSVHSDPSGSSPRRDDVLISSGLQLLPEDACLPPDDPLHPVPLVEWTTLATLRTEDSCSCTCSCGDDGIHLQARQPNAWTLALRFDKPLPSSAASGALMSIQPVRPATFPDPSFTLTNQWELPVLDSENYTRCPTVTFRSYARIAPGCSGPVLETFSTRQIMGEEEEVVFPNC